MAADMSSREGRWEPSHFAEIADRIRRRRDDNVDSDCTEPDDRLPRRRSSRKPSRGVIRRAADRRS